MESPATPSEQDKTKSLYSTGAPSSPSSTTATVTPTAAASTFDQSSSRWYTALDPQGRVYYIDR